MTGLWREWKAGTRLLGPKERSRLPRVFLLMVAAAVFESVAVASFLPFLEVAADPTAVERRAWLSALHGVLGSPAPRVFLAVLGAATLLALVGGNGLNAWSQTRVTRFAWDAYRSLSRRVLEAYLAAPYVAHLQRNPSDLVRGITGETGTFVGGWLLPGLQVASRAIVVALLMGTLLALEPVAALLALGTVGGAYAVILALARRRLDRLSQERDAASLRLHKAATEAMAAFREVRLYDTQAAVVGDFDDAAAAFARAQATAGLFATLPKYAVEVLALGAVVGLAVLLSGGAGGATSVMAFLGLFAMAGYRLVPALQICFASRTSMRVAAAARERLARDLGAAPVAADARPGESQASAAERPPPRRDFGLEQVTFRYPGTSAPVLEHVTVTIPVGQSTRITGRTGSGKSTLLDLLLGLIEPESGRLLSDGSPVPPAGRAAWRRHFAYVSQAPVLIDATVAENIAFGVPRDRIDRDRVRDAARTACLDDFIEGELPEGYDTVIGDRGCRWSGGQRQRLAIARALYTKRPILVLDEATNALDVEMERRVFSALSRETPALTIVWVTHRPDADGLRAREEGCLRVSAVGATDVTARATRDRDARDRALGVI